MHKGNTSYLPVVTETALEQAIQQIKSDCPQGVALVFVAEADAEHIPLLQRLASENELIIMGGLFPELIWQKSFQKTGMLFVLLDTKPVYQIIDKPAGKANSLLAQKLVDMLGDETDNRQTLFMLFDAMIPDIGSFLDEVYLQLGDEVIYIGVNAGSETFRPVECLFDNQQISGNAILVILLENSIEPVLEHGYQVPEHTIIATTTSGNRIKTIDWRSAFDVYQELVQQQFSVEVTRDNFYEYAVHFPFGIILADGDCLVRIPVALDDDGSLFCVGEIPENSVITLLHSPEPQSVHTAAMIKDKLVHKPENSMLFYCAGRRMHLGESALQELGELDSAAGKGNVSGALSLGEIGSLRSGSYPLFHNATIVIYPWDKV